MPHSHTDPSYIEPEVAKDWTVGETLAYEAHVYPTGVRLVAFDLTAEDPEDEDGNDSSAMVMAEGLEELDATIAVLQEARKLILALPEAKRGVPDTGENDEDGEEGDGDPIEEEEEEVD